MDVVYARCCGIDVHKATVVACLLCSEAGGTLRKQVRTLGTMTDNLLGLVDWLEQAATVYQAENASDARKRLAQWGEQWRVEAPQAVATLERGFEQTLVFYGSQKEAEVAIRLQVQRLHARWAGASWWETSHALYFELRNLNP